jgi:hypothetical protein
MCQRVTCSTCGKPTFAGCGRHIEAVLGDVPPDGRCHCRESSADKKAQPAKRGAGALSALCRAMRGSS